MIVVLTKNKKTLCALTVLFFLFFASDALTGTIAGSAHDFRTYLWNDTGEICLPCHTPHNAKSIAAPLWNHEISTETYVMYNASQSATLDADVSGEPDGISKLCLSCHDGTVAIENFGNKTDGTIFFFGPKALGIDLSNDHPISFLYDASLATTDGELYDPTTKLSGVPGGKGTINQDMLFRGRMECSSCHDVHNTKAAPGTKLLLKDNAGSALCLTCHNK